MTLFVVQDDSSKSYAVFTEEDGKFYEQAMVWWDRGGYHIPQTRKKITKTRYSLMMAQAKEVKIIL